MITPAPGRPWALQLGEPPRGSAGNPGSMPRPLWALLGLGGRFLPRFLSPPSSCRSFFTKAGVLTEGSIAEADRLSATGLRAVPPGQRAAVCPGACLCPSALRSSGSARTAGTGPVPCAVTQREDSVAFLRRSSLVPVTYERSLMERVPRAQTKREGSRTQHVAPFVLVSEEKITGRCQVMPEDLGVNARRPRDVAQRAGGSQGHWCHKQPDSKCSRAGGGHAPTRHRGPGESLAEGRCLLTF